MINWIKKQIAKRKIPHGDRCYHHTGYATITSTNGDTEDCPYFKWYEVDGDGDDTQLHGYCKYLKENNSRVLTEQFKICGVNVE